MLHFFNKLTIYGMNCQNMLIVIMNDYIDVRCDVWYGMMI